MSEWRITRCEECGKPRIVEIEEKKDRPYPSEMNKLAEKRCKCDEPLMATNDVSGVYCNCLTCKGGIKKCNYEDAKSQKHIERWGDDMGNDPKGKIKMSEA